MEVSYRRNLNRSYMIFNDIKEEEQDGYSFMMVVRNHIPGLLDFKYEFMNEKRVLLYDISSRQSLSKILETGMFSSVQLDQLLESLKYCTENMNRYLLDPGMLILDPEYIFYDSSHEQFSFCFFPFPGNISFEDIRKLFDRILNEIDYQDAELVKRFFKLHSMIQNENYNIFDLYEAELNTACKEDTEEKTDDDCFADEFLEQAANFDIQNEENEKESVWQSEQVDRKSIFTKLKMYLENKKTEGAFSENDDSMIINNIRRISGATGLKEMNLDDDEEQMFWNSVEFTEMPSPVPSLLHEKKDNRRRLVGTGAQQGNVVVIDKIPFSIGKLKGKIDCLLEESPVSRMHARIYTDKEGREYYIEDLNSTNGTFINGTKLDAYALMIMKPGDLIAFADQEFIFR